MMKASLYVMGRYRGEIELGENSLVGLLVRGEYRAAGEQIAALQQDLDAIAAGGEEEGQGQRVSGEPCEEA